MEGEFAVPPTTWKDTVVQPTDLNADLRAWAPLDLPRAEELTGTQSYSVAKPTTTAKATTSSTRPSPAADLVLGVEQTTKAAAVAGQSSRCRRSKKMR